MPGGEPGCIRMNASMAASCHRAEAGTSALQVHRGFLQPPAIQSSSAASAHQIQGEALHDWASDQTSETWKPWHALTGWSASRLQRPRGSADSARAPACSYRSAKGSRGGQKQGRGAIMVSLLGPDISGAGAPLRDRTAELAKLNRSQRAPGRGHPLQHQPARGAGRVDPDDGACRPAAVQPDQAGSWAISVTQSARASGAGLDRPPG